MPKVTQADLSKFLGQGINYQGEKVVGYLYDISVSPDGLNYYTRVQTGAGSASQPIVFVGVMHTNTSMRKEDEAFLGAADVTLETQKRIEDLFGDLSQRIIVINDESGRKCAFSRNSTYNFEANTYHYSGSVVNTITEYFFRDVIAPYETLINNSIPLWIQNRADVFSYGGAPLMASDSVVANSSIPYAVVKVTDTKAYGTLISRNVGTGGSEIDQWLEDDCELFFVGVNLAKEQAILNSIIRDYAQPCINKIQVKPVMKTTFVDDLNVVQIKSTYQFKCNYHLKSSQAAQNTIKSVGIAITER